MSLKAAGGSPRPTPAAGCRASGCRKKAAASWLVFPSVISRVRLVEVQVLIDDALVVNVLLDGGVSTVMHLLHGVVNVVLGVMANLLHALVRLLQEDLGDAPSSWGGQCGVGRDGEPSSCSCAPSSRRSWHRHRPPRLRWRRPRPLSPRPRPPRATPPTPPRSRPPPWTRPRLLRPLLLPLHRHPLRLPRRRR